jgi:hypothetical protein
MGSRLPVLLHDVHAKRHPKGAMKSGVNINERISTASELTSHDHVTVLWRRCFIWGEQPPLARCKGEVGAVTGDSSRHCPNI